MKIPKLLNIDPLESFLQNFILFSSAPLQDRLLALPTTISLSSISLPWKSTSLVYPTISYQFFKVWKNALAFCDATTRKNKFNYIAKSSHYHCPNKSFLPEKYLPRINTLAYFARALRKKKSLNMLPKVVKFIFLTSLFGLKNNCIGQTLQLIFATAWRMKKV